MLAVASSRIEDARVGQQRAGEGDQLALPDAEVAPALADLRVVALGQLHDDVVHADGARRRLDLRVAWRRGARSGCSRGSCR